MNRFTLPVSTFCLMSLPVCSIAQDQTDAEAEDSGNQIQMKMEIQPTLAGRTSGSSITNAVSKLM